MIFFYGITNSIFMVILVFNRDRRIYFVKNNLKSILAVLNQPLKERWCKSLKKNEASAYTVS